MQPPFWFWLFITALARLMLSRTDWKLAVMVFSKALLSLNKADTWLNSVLL